MIPYSDEVVKKDQLSCKDGIHMYNCVDEPDPYSSPAAQNRSLPYLTQVYGGKYVKHLLCSRCGDYRAVELKVDKSLEPFVKMRQMGN